MTEVYHASARCAICECHCQQPAILYFSISEREQVKHFCEYVTGLIVGGKKTVTTINAAWIVGITIYFMWTIAVPTKIRKFVMILSIIDVSNVALNSMNHYFHWGWNFPDDFGVVSGTARIVFAIIDRYLSSR